MTLWKPRSAAGFRLDYFSICYDSDIISPRMIQSPVQYRLFITSEDMSEYSGKWGPSSLPALYNHVLTWSTFRELPDVLHSCLRLLDIDASLSPFVRHNSEYEYYQFLYEYGLEKDTDTPINPTMHLRLLLRNARDIDSIVAAARNAGRLPVGFGEYLARRCLSRGEDIGAALTKVCEALPDEIDWSYLSETVPIAAILARQDLPWDWEIICAFNDWLSIDVIERFPLLPWQWGKLTQNVHLSHQWLRNDSRTVPFIRRSSHTERTHRLRKSPTVFWWVWQLDETFQLWPYLHRHGAAGVLQRCWRRHRERLRRRDYARQLAADRLAVLPRDLQWLVYSYVRPVAVLRGLPRALW